MFKITAAKSDAQITVEKSRGDEAVIRVASESGIGSADIEITSEAPPKRLVLQFHLRGLEELRFAYDTTIATSSISSTNPNQIRQSVQQGGSKSTQESIITASSPYWMPIRIVSQDASVKFPLQDGYIEVEAPQDFIKGKHRKFSIHWIDFYR